MPAAGLWRLASERLTDDQWRAFVLVFGEELTYREAAIALDLDESSVRGRIRRAFKRIGEAT